MKDEMILELDNTLLRPTILTNGITALFDTGALIPMANMRASILEKQFGARVVIKDAEISGIGGVCKGSVYTIPVFTLSKLTYPEFHVFVPNNRIKGMADFLFSATMFNGLIYEIDTPNHRMLIRVPDKESCVRNLRIYDSKGKLYVLANSSTYEVETDE